MGADDKIKNVATEATGKVKETVGKATNNPDLQAEGELDQTKAELGKAKENVKDAFEK